MKDILRIKKRIHAQAMVEFALILPVLLAIVFGMLEVGRMVFIYVTIATASREAVRYGSATGEITTGGTIKRYEDCVGIRAAAERVNFLKAFTDSDIVITFDHGLDVAGNPVAWPGTGCQAGLTPPTNVIEGDRIHVVVTGQFNPIVDLSGIGFPLLSHQTFQNSNFHTLLGSVSIDRPWQGGSGNGGGSGGGGGGGGIGGALPTPTETLPPTNTLAPTNTALPTVTPKPCQVTSITDPTVDTFYTKFLWTINANMPVTIQSIHISWPSGSGNLTGITIDGQTTSLNNNPPSAEIQGSILPGGGNLGAGAHNLAFLFSNNPLAGLFQVSINFSSQSCNTLFGAVTLYPVTHSGSFPNAASNSNTAGPWTIYNHTGQPLYVNYILITWSKGQACASKAALTAINLATNNLTVSPGSLQCNGYSLIPVNWTIPIGTSTMSLGFSQVGVKDIVVQIGLTGQYNNPTSYILDSSNPNQNQ